MGTRVRLRRALEWSGRDAWPFLLLLLVVLVPTGFLLWFMNDAIARQSIASRQIALEGYRGQLRLLRARTDLFWQPYADRLEAEPSHGVEKPTPLSPEERFAQLVLADRLDGAVLLEADGRMAFPRLAGTRSVKPVSTEAVSVQDAVREVVQQGERTKALERIEQFVQRGDIRGVGRDGRLITADLQLLAVQGLLPEDPERSTRAERLAALLNDYGVSMASAQRLFVMGELRRMMPKIRIPTEDALQLSTQVIESGGPPHHPGAFRPTLMKDIWALSSANRRVIGLYRTAHLQAMLDDALRQLAPQGIRYTTYPPDAGGDQEAIAAGPALPGWQVSFAVFDSSPISAAWHGRLLTYLWVGFAAIATIALLGVIAGQTFGRQFRLARLKTDLTAAVSHELVRRLPRCTSWSTDCWETGNSIPSRLANTFNSSPASTLG